MSDTPVRTAFCPLLFAHNGGQFIDGKPVRNGQVQILSKCDAPYDCGECTLMTTWLVEQVQLGHVVGWECVRCLEETSGISRWLPGFFQSSKYREVLGGGQELIEPDRLLEGCTRCDAPSIALQLVLRRSP